MGLLKWFKDFRILDKKIVVSFENIHKDQEHVKERLARVEGAISVLLQQNNKVPSPKSQASPKKIETFENKVIKRIRSSKKDMIIKEIKNLSNSMTTSEMENFIVNQKGLCVRSSFYRYLASLKSQLIQA